MACDGDDLDSLESVRSTFLLSTSPFPVYSIVKLHAEPGLLTLARPWWSHADAAFSVLGSCARFR